MQCPTARLIWFHVLRDTGLLHFMPQTDSKFREWWCSLKLCQPKNKRIELASISIACCRRIWLERNNRVFDRQSATEETLIRLIKDEVQAWSLAWQIAGQGKE
jgi:hypothetical protein